MRDIIDTDCNSRSTLCFMDLWDSLIKNKIKNKQHSIFDLHQKNISKNFEERQDGEDLPEKSKQIKQHLDQERC